MSAQNFYAAILLRLSFYMNRKKEIRCSLMYIQGLFTAWKEQLIKEIAYILAL